MEETVQRNEMLYRVIKRSQPDTIDNDGRPTSALFKQENGERDPLGQLKALILADKSEIVTYEPEVDWV